MRDRIEYLLAIGFILSIVGIIFAGLLALVGCEGAKKMTETQCLCSKNWTEVMGYTPYNGTYYFPSSDGTTMCYYEVVEIRCFPDSCFPDSCSPNGCFPDCCFPISFVTQEDNGCLWLDNS